MEPLWHVVAASAQGTAHQKHQTPCQDAHGARILGGETVIIAVADGAGAADRSAEGAQCVVAEAMAALEAALTEAYPQDTAGWQALMTDAFRRARRAVLELAQAENRSARAFATTLTCAVAGDGWLAVGQIGDGVAVARGEDGALFAASQPQHGEYANETFFLTMDGALQHLQVHAYPQPVQALAVMTDGLVRLATHVRSNEPHAPFFQPLWRFAVRVKGADRAQKRLADFLASERVCARTDDDKTLVLAVRPAAGMEPTEGQ